MKARPTRKKVMAVLDRVFSEGGYKITVRSYNKILTGLGYRLGNYGLKKPRTPPHDGQSEVKP